VIFGNNIKLQLLLKWEYNQVRWSAFNESRNLFPCGMQIIWAVHRILRLYRFALYWTGISFSEPCLRGCCWTAQQYECSAAALSFSGGGFRPGRRQAASCKYPTTAQARPQPSVAQQRPAAQHLQQYPGCLAYMVKFGTLAQCFCSRQRPQLFVCRVSLACQVPRGSPNLALLRRVFTCGAGASPF